MLLPCGIDRVCVAKLLLHRSNHVWNKSNGVVPKQHSKLLFISALKAEFNLETHLKITSLAFVCLCVKAICSWAGWDKNLLLRKRLFLDSLTHMHTLFFFYVSLFVTSVFLRFRSVWSPSTLFSCPAHACFHRGWTVTWNTVSTINVAEQGKHSAVRQQPPWG